MGIMLQKEDDLNEELTRKISADLRAKMDATQNPVGDEKTPNFAEDSEYVKDFSKTGRFAWVWIMLTIVAVVALIVLGLQKGGAN